MFNKSQSDKVRIARMTSDNIQFLTPQLDAKGEVIRNYNAELENAVRLDDTYPDIEKNPYKNGLYEEFYNNQSQAGFNGEVKVAYFPEPLKFDLVNSKSPKKTLIYKLDENRPFAHKSSVKEFFKFLFGFFI